MNHTLHNLAATIEARRADPQEGSYTNYLFEQGLDKILKKIGEECAETLIAAKNGDNLALTGEICDLLYHVLVLMNERALSLEGVLDELETRRQKIGNHKIARNADRLT
jgi:phosphoribosyl-ATP pyrophosphohydrolase